MIGAILICIVISFGCWWCIQAYHATPPKKTDFTLIGIINFLIVIALCLNSMSHDHQPTAIKTARTALEK